MSENDVTPGEAFQLAVSRAEPTRASLHLSGEVDLATAPALRDCIAEMAPLGVIHLEVDLTNLTFIDSTGIGVLVQNLERLSEAGGSLVVRNARPEAMKVFQITGLVELLSVTPIGTDPTPGSA
jgi:anti-sigma B factor antagonist